MTILAAIAIGRNEAPRLRRCLESLLRETSTVVYVDSGSSDGSRELAAQLGAAVVELDLNRPFTAARARNAGIRWLREQGDAEIIRYVQFVDGDCVLRPGWTDAAVSVMESSPDLAVACGRRREEHPEVSVYNRLCDIEWDTPVGEALSCGGDAMVRLSALLEAGGYNDEIIAGEEPELCLRLRRLGYRIVRLDAEMTLHDARITSWRSWWRRMVRAGHAYVEGFWRHGLGPERHWRREAVRPWLWTVLWPLAITLAVVLVSGWALLGVTVYLVQGARAAVRVRRRGRTWADSIAWGVSCTIGKWAELQGQLRFLRHRLLRRQSEIIEYRGPASAPPVR